MAAADSFQVSLNEFEKNTRTTWQTLQSEGEFCDMTIACEEKLIQTHKVVISAMSPILGNILKQNSSHHPYIYLRGVKYNILTNLLNFIYQGEVHILEEDINNFLEIGMDLEISGISEVQYTSESSPKNNYDKRIVSIEEKSKKFEIETTESVAEYINDLDIDCELNEVVGKENDNIKIEGSGIFVAFNSENKLNSTINLNIEDNKPVKEVIYASEINVNSTDIEPYCNLCSRMYNSLASLSVHKASIHEGINYPCDGCDFKATQKHNLIRHIKTIHDGIRYPCNQCDKDFGDLGAMRRHGKIIHDGVRKQCEMCDKKCRDTASLKKHMALVHDDYMSKE